jgi:hypothetical protein
MLQLGERLAGVSRAQGTAPTRFCHPRLPARPPTQYMVTPGWEKVRMRGMKCTAKPASAWFAAPIQPGEETMVACGAIESPSP